LQISQKLQDLEKEEAKKSLEMSANVAEIAKVTRILLASKNRKKHFCCSELVYF